MERVWTSHAEAIGEALAYLPARLRGSTACDFFCGDPIFAGINASGWANETLSDGVRSYRRVAHCCFPYHVRDKRVTVVLPPKCPDVGVILHELGHVLHWNLLERAEVPRLDVVSDYAATNVWEEFAEAFLAWFYTPKQLDTMPYWCGYSRGNDEFFNRLGRC